MNLSDIDKVAVIAERLKKIRQLHAALDNPPLGTKVFVSIKDPQGNVPVSVEFPMEAALKTLEEREADAMEDLTDLGVNVNA